MLHFVNLLLVMMALLPQELTPEERGKIEIIDDDKYVPYQETHFDGGPAQGNILNAHYFPGINLYNAGRYTRSEQEFSYVILRPQYLSANPRRDEFMSICYYLRGMIYFYHSNGFGRYTAAKEDFEGALKWNSRNYIAYVELARLYAALGFQEHAISLLRNVLELMPDEKIAEEARKQLDAFTKPATAPTRPSKTQINPQNAH